MPTVDELLQEFPAASQDRLKKAWEALPASVQDELRNSRRASAAPSIATRGPTSPPMASTEMRIVSAILSVGCRRTTDHSTLANRL